MFQKLEDLRIFKRAEELSDRLWTSIATWKHFERNTVGSQLVRAADSIGANIAEGYGRQHAKDSLHFYYISRASLQETKFWLKRAQTRKLLDDKIAQEALSSLDILSKQLNAFISSQRLPKP
jgi:four helix bundle protein